MTAQKRRPRVEPQLQTDSRPQVQVPEDLGKLILRDAELVRRLGWAKFVLGRRGKGDLTDMRHVQHPARRLLRRYATRGVPARLSTPAWTTTEVETALQRGPHQSCHKHADFLFDEFSDMINLNYWLVLPYSVARTLPNLHISPPGVVWWTNV